MIRQFQKTLLEYIWLDGKGQVRSKTRVVNATLPPNIEYIPEWNYDGSSTYQADSNGNTEIILKPCCVFKDSSRNISYCDCYLVLCDTYTSNNEPTVSNHRYLANQIFENSIDYEPWFGLEQEYFMVFYDETLSGDHYCGNTSGDHYCGNTSNIERTIAEKHLTLCIETGLHISGINSEVSNGQWEFQIGPCQGIDAADELIIARYLLERVAERYNVNINYMPKPYDHINGSGCHINFSTNKTRCSDGITEIYRCINNLSETHDEIIKIYGTDNDKRLTGFHETSSYHKFSWGVGTRNTSIRIPNKTIIDSCGYIEDRRPASNIDPYLATSKLFKICYP